MPLYAFYKKTSSITLTACRHAVPLRSGRLHGCTVPAALQWVSIAETLPCLQGYLMLIDSAGGALQSWIVQEAQMLWGMVCM